MSRIFFSDLRERPKEVPGDFSDNFDIASVHSSGVSILKGGEAACGILIHSHQSGPDHAQKIGQIISSAISSLEIEKSGRSLSATLYLLWSGREGESNSPEGTQSQDKSGILIGIVAGKSNPQRALSGVWGLGKSTSEVDYAAEVEKSISLAASFAETVAREARKEKIILKRISKQPEFMRLSRLFWTGVSNTDVPGPEASPSDFYAASLNIYPSRLFWATSFGAIHQVYLAKTMPQTTSSHISSLLSESSPQLDKVDVASLCGDFAQFKSDKRQELPGVHFVSWSVGGQQVYAEKNAALGIGTFRKLEGMKIKGLSSDKRSSLAMWFDDRWRKVTGKKDEKVSSTNSSKSIKMVRGYVSITPIDGFLKDSLGTWSEASAIRRTENTLLGHLSELSGGADWGVIDGSWLQALYSIVPGSLRLNTQAATRYLDLICINHEEEPTTL